MINHLIRTIKNIRYLLQIYFLKYCPERFIDYISFAKAQKVSKDAIISVPAYKDFLSKTLYFQENNDFSFNKLPVTNKSNYINKYKESKLTYQPIYKMYAIESSSGYSGKNHYWFRDKKQDIEVQKYMENLVYEFKLQNKKFLLINTFTLGLWVTGEKLSRMFKNLSQKKYYDFTVASVGSDYDQTIELFNLFYSYYDEIVFAGYPPFLKDILETLSLKKYKGNIKISLFSGGESFSEGWRVYMKTLITRMGLECGQVISVYGAADININIGFETEISIELRKLLKEKPELINKITGYNTNILPSVLQYNPLNLYIESVKDHLTFTCSGGIPLIRYDIQDKGTVVSTQKVFKILKDNGLDIINKVNFINLPFLFVFGRHDGTISINGINIYVELLHEIMTREDIIHIHTGKYRMFKEDDEDTGSKFVVEVEIKNGKQNEISSLEEFLSREILEHFKKRDNSFADGLELFPKNMIPRIKLINPRNVKKKDIKNRYITN